MSPAESVSPEPSADRKGRVTVASATVSGVRCYSRARDRPRSRRGACLSGTDHRPQADRGPDDPTGRGPSAGRTLLLRRDPAKDLGPPGISQSLVHPLLELGVPESVV